LSPAQIKKLKLWIDLASEVVEKLIHKDLLPGKINSLSISLLICGEKRIRDLNREYRQKDKVTDVLSFPIHENLRTTFNRGDLFLGDLAICFPRARKQAREFKIGEWDEFIHLFFHGILHLMSYDHEVSEKEELLMQDWEDKALDLFSKLKKR
jgi:probable rRNA maturation factor